MGHRTFKITVLIDKNKTEYPDNKVTEDLTNFLNGAATRGFDRNIEVIKIH